MVTSSRRTILSYFPLVLLFAHKIIPSYKGVVITLLLLASLLSSALLIDKYPSSTFYLLHTRAWELLLGSVVAIYPITKYRSPWLYQVTSITALAIITYCIVRYGLQYIISRSSRATTNTRNCCNYLGQYRTQYICQKTTLSTTTSRYRLNILFTVPLALAPNGLYSLRFS